MKPPAQSIPSPSEPPDGPLHLGMFGKHPTYADHLEDAGLSTPALAAFKRRFYVDGLTACINRSLWLGELPLPPLLPYDHCLLTVDAEGWTAARLVAAQDASGRGQYPFVQCLHSADHRWLRAAPAFWPWLDERTAAARRADTAGALRESFDQARADLRGLRADRWTRGGGAESARRQWARNPLLAPGEGLGLERVTHALSPEGSGAEQVRVALPATAPAADGALLWASFVSHLLADPAVTVVWRADGAFADLASGQPRAALFHPLFAPAAKVGLTTAIPFQITPKTREHVAASVAAWMADPELFGPWTVPASAVPILPPFLEQAALRLRSWWHR